MLIDEAKIDPITKTNIFFGEKELSFVFNGFSINSYEKTEIKKINII